MAQAQSGLGFGGFGELDGGEFGELEFEEPSTGTDQFLDGILGAVPGQTGSPLGEAEETSLASELMEITSEEELEQFLGSLVRRAASAAGGFIKSPMGRALGGLLKNVAKKAFPAVGGALGSMIAPGVGTAIGTKLGSMASGMFELELEAMPADEAEFEVARRVVGLTARAAQNAALAQPRAGVGPHTVARAAVAKAARTYAPGLHRSLVQSLRTTLGAGSGVAGMPGARVALPVPAAGAAANGGPALSGRWVRRGRKILLLGV